MRNAVVQLCLVVMGVSSIHAVKLLQTSSFHVRLFPARVVERVWAVQDRDSIELMAVNGEYYVRSIPPGHWELCVDAKAPYRSAHFEILGVDPGTDKDLGEVHLQGR
jgi:hypothetical protein